MNNIYRFVVSIYGNGCHSLRRETYSLGQMLLPLLMCNLSRSHKLVYLGAVVTLDIYLWGLYQHLRIYFAHE